MVAQLVEHWIPNPSVAGSIPVQRVVKPKGFFFYQKLDFERLIMQQFYYYRVHHQPIAQVLKAGEFNRKNSFFKPSKMKRLILADGMFESLADKFLQEGWRVLELDTSEVKAQKFQPLLEKLYQPKPTMAFSDFAKFDLFYGATFTKGLDVAKLNVGGRLSLTDKKLLDDELSFLLGLELPKYLYE